MRFTGIDIGSRTIEVVVIEKERVVENRQTDTGFDPMAQAGQLLTDVRFDHIMATGYGRNLFEIAFDAPTVTEIKAYGVGINALIPQAHTILDIGGQDSKAIALNGSGVIRKFEMNDRCAAGTGKFLEIMARTLGFELHRILEPKPLRPIRTCTSTACAQCLRNLKSPPWWPRDGIAAPLPWGCTKASFGVQ